MALTACLSERGSKPSGFVLKFDDISTQTGINNISSFRSTGKFTCESEGLYLISSWVESGTSFARFGVYRNNFLLANAYITYTDRGSVVIGTGTAVIAVELQVGDLVYVKTKTNMIPYISSKDSCLTIAKLK